MTIRLAILALGLGVGVAGSLAAQESRNLLPADTAMLIATAREASARFADRSAAIAAGYRLVGGEFPAMGEHWVHPGIVMSGEAHADQPAVLSYVTRGDAPLLAGVAWALPLAPGAALAVAPVAEWHLHGGSIAEASFAPHRGSGSGWRLAVLHAWVWCPNSRGTFRTDNWSLPWHQLGLTPPATPDPDAARALSLLHDDASFWRAWLRHRGQAEADDLLSQAAAAVRANLAAGADESALAATWRRLAHATGLPSGEGEGH